MELLTRREKLRIEGTSLVCYVGRLHFMPFSRCSIIWPIHYYWKLTILIHMLQIISSYKKAGSSNGSRSTESLLWRGYTVSYSSMGVNCQMSECCKSLVWTDLSLCNEFSILLQLEACGQSSRHPEDAHYVLTPCLFCISLLVFCHNPSQLCNYCLKWNA